MECHNSGFRRIMPVLPKPLRCGERGYSDMVKGFCSPPSAIVAAFYSLEQGGCDRMPFDSLPGRCGAGMLGTERLVKDADYMASRLPSWNPSEGIRPPSWNPLEGIRPPSWNPLEGIRPSSWNPCESIRPPSWNLCEGSRPPSWNPCEAIRPPSWNPNEGGRPPSWSSCDACYKCCSPLENFSTLDDNGIDPSSADDCPGRMSPTDDRTMARPSLNCVLSQPVNTPLCGGGGGGGGGDRVFKCDHPECPKSFTRKEELTRHKRTHSNERAFECQICSRKFIRKDHMTKHLATHEDVAKRRRYVCKEPGCSRRYTRSDALSRHRAAAHPEHRPLGNFDITQ